MSFSDGLCFNLLLPTSWHLHVPFATVSCAPTLPFRSSPSSAAGAFDGGATPSISPGPLGLIILLIICPPPTILRPPDDNHGRPTDEQGAFFAPRYLMHQPGQPPSQPSSNTPPLHAWPYSRVSMCL